MAPSDQPIGLVVKLPFGSEQEFLQRYGANLSKGGIYLRAKGLKAPGTPVTLEVKLQSGARLLYASAVVEFVTGAKGEGIPGMGLRFVTVDLATQRFLDTAALLMPHARQITVPLPKNVGPADTSPDAVPAPTPPSQEQAPLPSQQSGRLVISGDDASLRAPPFEASPLPPREGPILGIDLGTTNSCAASVREGKPQVIKSREGYNTVPSVVALSPRGKLLVGHGAKAQLLTNPKLTVYGAKRLVGRAYDSATVQEIKDRFTYVICEGPEGEAAVRLADQIYSLEQISALILREVRELASAQLKVPVCRAVITVPAWYNDNQRQAVRRAGALAGLHVERIVNEPTAAALAYAWGRKLSQRVLVYDLGGGTFDASVLELSDTVYEVLSTGGDTFLGGIDFDSMIVAWILEQFTAKTGKPFVGDRVGTQRLNDAAERAKIALSERNEARIHVPFATLIDNAPYDIDLTLTRQQLEILVGGLVDRTSSVVREVLESKGLQPSDIDEVLLVGGQSRSPLVQEKLTAFFGKPPAKAVHPDEAVALGAAVLANALQTQEGLVLIDVLPQSVGVGLPGGRFFPVIRRNTALPVTRKHTHATTRDNQDHLALSVFQGESPRAQDNEFLGTLKLSGLPKGPKGSVRVEITFELTNEGLLKLKAREGASGAEVATVLATRDTPEAVRAALESDESGGPPEGSEAAQPPAPEARLEEPTKKSGGFFGWLKGVFGRP